jgi:hypothetical protein
MGCFLGLESDSSSLGGGESDLLKGERLEIELPMLERLGSDSRKLETDSRTLETVSRRLETDSLKLGIF